MQTTRSDGLWPRYQAGNATEAMIDFRWRGGTVMISRFTSPEATWETLWVIASICQFGLNGVPGRTKPKTYSTNILKSVARIARSSNSGEMFSGEGGRTGAFMTRPPDSSFLARDGVRALCGCT